MQKNFTIRSIAMHVRLLTSIFMMLSMPVESTLAQSFCASETTLFIENFGSGTTSTSNPDIITNSLIYKATGNLDVEGVYRVINNTKQNPVWHSSTDHTGNTNGKMLVINGNGNTFYRHVVNNPLGFQAGYYSISMFFMNVNMDVIRCVPGFSPNISFLLEYQATDNSWVAMGGSTVSAPFLASPTWIRLGSVFTLPINSGIVIKNIRLSINDGTIGLCGNDYAIDDIKLAACASEGPLPVEFSKISARQKGAGIAIEWSTASEYNSKYFDVENSVDGGKSWNLVSTTIASGNSSVVKSYSTYDAKPFAGVNYYRIKQVDLDGKFKYSYTVKVKVNTEKTSASVISNPFITNIEIDFNSKINQPVYLTLFDVTGKVVSSTKISIPNGASRMTFDKINNIQKGIYVLSIVDEFGYSIYKGKLVKQ